MQLVNLLPDRRRSAGTMKEAVSFSALSCKREQVYGFTPLCSFDLPGAWPAIRRWRRRLARVEENGRRSQARVDATRVD